MKITRYAMVFLLVAISMTMLLHLNVQRFNVATNRKVEYNEALDTALDSAVSGIVEKADGYNVEVNKNVCVNNFYRSLCASFDATDNEIARQKLMLYTPVLAVANVHGLDVYHSYLYGGTGQATLKKVWSQTIPYTATSSVGAGDNRVNFTVIFDIKKTLKILIEGNPNIYSGSWVQLQQSFGGKDEDDDGIIDVKGTPPTPGQNQIHKVLTESDYLNNHGNCELWRSAVITETVVNQLGYYVNEHNQIARSLGEQFTFRLPETSSSEVARGVTDVSFICFFQGYPYGQGTSEVYSKFEISGARIAKNEGFYVQPVQEDGGQVLYYHVPGCTKGTGKRNWYSDKDKCALSGALPCPYCNP